MRWKEDADGDVGVPREKDADEDVGVPRGERGDADEDVGVPRKVPDRTSAVLVRRVEEGL